jgi:hypothetical protein
MDKIVAPINVQDRGPAVANLQQAMLFIVEKKQFSPANHSFDQWKQVMSDELAQQVFGQRTLQLLLAVLPALHLPGAEFVTPAVADALNNVLAELGAFVPPPPPPPVEEPPPIGERAERSFDNYRFEYGITNPNGKNLVRIDFFSGEVKVGQALFGDAIAPGSFASLMQDEIDLFFPLIHFANILNLLLTQKSPSLFVDLDPDSHQVTGGGIMTAGSPENR